MDERLTIRAALRRVIRYRGTLRGFSNVLALVDPEFPHKVAVRLNAPADGPAFEMSAGPHVDYVEDYLVDTSEDRWDYAVEEVEWRAWPPVGTDGGPSDLTNWSVLFTTD